MSYIEINIYYIFLKSQYKIHPYFNFVNKWSYSCIETHFLQSFPRLSISASGRAIVIPKSACSVSRVISRTTCEQNLAHKFNRMEMASRPISRAIFSSFSLLPSGALNVILLFRTSLSRSAATEKSKDATHADHVPSVEANLFSSAVTFDSLCHSRPYVRAIYLSNLGKMSIMFQPRGFVAGIRIFGRFMAVSAVESRRFSELWGSHKTSLLLLFLGHRIALILRVVNKCFYVLCFYYSLWAFKSYIRNIPHFR